MFLWRADKCCSVSAGTKAPRMPFTSVMNFGSWMERAKMKTATYIRDVHPTATGRMKLYRLSKSVEYDAPAEEDSRQTDHVVVSAANTYSGPETYIFPANEGGDILSWLELDGSFRGGLDHQQALKNAGYKVIDNSLIN